MRILEIVGLIGLVCAFARAGGEMVPAHLVGEMRYDDTTGRIGAAPLSRGQLPALWSVTDLTGDAYVSPEGYGILDWGDIEAGLPIGELAFTFVTNSQATAGDNTVVLVLYSDENGWCGAGGPIVAAYTIQNIPGSTHPASEYWGYIWRLTPFEPFVIDGDDLDGDGLADFGYGLWNQTLRSSGSRGGVLVAGPTDPNRPQYSAGIEDAFDVDGEGECDTINFGGNPFAQFYFELSVPSCSNEPGDEGCLGDTNFDCVVDLQDLANLLGHYGESEDALWWEGDFEPDQRPLPGDGDVDLADLAALLANYGMDCRQHARRFYRHINATRL